MPGVSNDLLPVFQFPDRLVYSTVCEISCVTAGGGAGGGGCAYFLFFESKIIKKYLSFIYPFDPGQAV